MRKFFAAVVVFCFLSVGLVNVAASPFDRDPAGQSRQGGCKAEVVEEGYGVFALIQAIKGVIIHLMDSGKNQCGASTEVKKSKFGVIIH